MAGSHHPEISDLPADKALKKLMAERGLSNRKLAAATRQIDPGGRGLGHASIGNIARGDDRASASALALIAHAAGVDPAYFAEYRLALARRALDEREVGLEQALETLKSIEAALADRTLGPRPEDEPASDAPQRPPTTARAGRTRAAS